VFHFVTSLCQFSAGLNAGVSPPIVLSLLVGLGLLHIPCLIEMDADERDICLYLKGFPGQFISFREISKRAGGKRRFRNEPEWATPVVSRLVERGILESDSTAHYRLKAKPKKQRTERWMSPEIRKILEKSGKEFNGVFEVDEDNDELTKE
jgi:hypothetical protein